MKEMNIEIFPFLEKLSTQPGKAPISGFRLDFEIIKKAMTEHEMEERIFYWIPRTPGGVCVKERNVFILGSDDHRIWTTLYPSKEQTEAYCITLTGGRPRTPIGSVRSFDYPSHLCRLKKSVLNARALDLIFYSGTHLTMSQEEYRQTREQLFWAYGTIRCLRYLPESEAELARVISMERRFQRGWQPKRQTPTAPER